LLSADRDKLKPQGAPDSLAGLSGATTSTLTRISPFGYRFVEINTSVQPSSMYWINPAGTEVLSRAGETRDWPPSQSAAHRSCLVAPEDSKALRY